MSPEIKITYIQKFNLQKNKKKKKIPKLNFQKYRIENIWNAEIQITDIKKYKLQNYKNLNYRNT